MFGLELGMLRSDEEVLLGEGCFTMVVEECPLPVVCFISIELLTVFHMLHTSFHWIGPK